MKKGMRFLCLIIVFTMLPFAGFANAPAPAVEVKAKSAILMEAETGQILYENNADERLPIASVTKVMTMLLAMEALQSGKINMNDYVTTSEHAASMGGSQVYLEPGEKISMDECLKAIAVASGNDAAVALAEHIFGSEAAFVNAMNERAKALGAKNTNFVNCNGLDEDNHYSSARDVAIISRELLKHKEIIKYTTIWMDTIRNGEFSLANTNKLIRFYNGAIGLKTGSTGKAKYCLSSAATRNNLTLIAVVLAAETSPERFASASKLLDYGFANYSIARAVNKGETVGKLNITKGKEKQVDVVAAADFKKLVPKGSNTEIEKKINIYNEVNAPVAANQKVGEAVFSLNGAAIGKVDLVAKSNVGKLTFFDVYAKVIKRWSIGL